ncbi:MAG: hypothetical protein F6K30_16325 [Cyanothece sp. SIO2G6]|nr:hypothetical protein [Cyanothece sp. SIO2G6]
MWSGDHTILTFGGDRCHHTIVDKGGVITHTTATIVPEGDRIDGNTGAIASMPVR